jgi:hypothetical protein
MICFHQITIIIDFENYGSYCYISIIKLENDENWIFFKSLHIDVSKRYWLQKLLDLNDWSSEWIQLTKLLITWNQSILNSKQSKTMKTIHIYISWRKKKKWKFSLFLYDLFIQCIYFELPTNKSFVVFLHGSYTKVYLKLINAPVFIYNLFLFRIIFNPTHL